MNVLDINSFPDCVEKFLCANTPAYLYTHLKKLQEVESIAEKLPTKKLYKICKEALEVKEKNYDSELAFYISLIALSFKPYSETFECLQQLKTDLYKWANNIISLIIEGHVPITEYGINVENIPKIISSQEEPKETSDTAISGTIILKNIPTIDLPQGSSIDSITSDTTINIEYNGDKKND